MRPLDILVRAAAPIGLAAILLCPGAGLANHDDVPVESLTSYDRLDPDAVTVSGLSSGAFFAHQFHVAYSGLVKGAGIVAGGPYGCAEQVESVSPPFLPAVAVVPRRVVLALAVCTRFNDREFRQFGWTFPDNPNAEDSLRIARDAGARGLIDDPANLASSRVWLFHGDRDTLVPRAVVDAVRIFYERMGLSPGANLQVQPGPDARHGFPIKALAEGSANPHCRRPDPSFLIECDYGAAELLLRHLYPDRPGAPSPGASGGRVIAFDQREFFDPADASTSLNDVGYAYVPAACANGAPSSTRCRLHVAFHGCEQYVDKIHDRFFRSAGYNPRADANNVIVLYPQATRWDRLSDPSGLTANPKGCWDWWGYSGEGYYGRNGKQMRAVKAMIDRMSRR